MELSGREEVHPFSRVVGAKDAEICFDFLIGSFGLSISLWMVGLCQISGSHEGQSV